MTQRLRVHNTFVEVGTSLSEQARDAGRRRSLSDGCLWRRPAEDGDTSSKESEASRYFARLSDELNDLSRTDLCAKFFITTLPGKADTAMAESTAVGSVSSSLEAEIYNDGQQSRASGLVTAGSVGHPELCSRPCLYYARGQCSKAEGCFFCHGPHERQHSLSRSQRELAQQLPPGQLLELLEPLVRGRCQVAGVKLGRDAWRRCRESLGRGGARLGGRRLNPSQSHSLALALRRLELKGLLGTASRLLRPVSEEAGDLFRDLLRDLRLAAGNMTSNVEPES